MIPIYGICGTSGEGKTRLVSAVLAEASRQRWSTRGVYCPAVFEGNMKTAIAVRLIPGTESRILMRLAQPGDSQVFGQWNLDLESIAWARTYLLDFQPADIWIIDEIGPLEIIYGQGWAEILPYLPLLPARKVLVSFRSSLQPWFLEHYPGITITTAGQPDAEAALLQSLFR